MTSVMESSPAPLLKMDVLGRVKTPPARREQLLDEFARRGTSGHKFAGLVGVKHPTFATWVQQRKRRRDARRERTTRLPENLPVIEQVLDPEPVQAQPDQWRCLGEEVNEQLDYEPGRFLRRRIIRRKYVHRTERDLAPVIAPLG